MEAKYMNRKIGIYSSAVLFLAVLGFAVSMIAGTDFGSYLSSIFIALGFVPMVCSLSAANGRKAAGLTAIAFACVYAVLIGLVYFAQLTTVSLTPLSGEAAMQLNYSNFGLMFNYDLLGYAFMALSTFFIGLTIAPENKGDKWLRGMLLVHGIFAIACFIMPMLGIFRPGMEGGDLIGTLVLEFWCAYFIPVSILAFRHFVKTADKAEA